MTQVPEELFETGGDQRQQQSENQHATSWRLFSWVPLAVPLRVPLKVPLRVPLRFPLRVLFKVPLRVPLRVPLGAPLRDGFMRLGGVGVAFSGLPG